MSHAHAAAEKNIKNAVEDRKVYAVLEEYKKNLQKLKEKIDFLRGYL